MRLAMNDAATRAITQMLFTPFPSGNISAYVTLNVSRDNLVADALRELSRYDSSELKKPLKVKIKRKKKKKTIKNYYFYNCSFFSKTKRLLFKNVGKIS